MTSKGYGVIVEGTHDLRVLDKYKVIFRNAKCDYEIVEDSERVRPWYMIKAVVNKAQSDFIRKEIYNLSVPDVVKRRG